MGLSIVSCLVGKPCKQVLDLVCVPCVAKHNACDIVALKVREWRSVALLEGDRDIRLLVRHLLLSRSEIINVSANVMLGVLHTEQMLFVLGTLAIIATSHFKKHKKSN